MLLPVFFKKTPSFLGASLLVWLISPCGFCLIAAEPPGILNHQGRIAVSGVNHSGPGYFKFALVNATGNTTYWSNDGTSTAGSEPAAAVETPVASGHYSIPLGDTSYHSNMKGAIPKTVFMENADVRLAIWFGTGVGRCGERHLLTAPLLQMHQQQGHRRRGDPRHP